MDRPRRDLGPPALALPAWPARELVPPSAGLASSFPGEYAAATRQIMRVALPGLSADHLPKVVASFERIRSQERGNHFVQLVTDAACLSPAL